MTALAYAPFDLPSTEPAAVSATALTRTYGEGGSAVHALRGVSLEVPQGQFAAVTGPSGSGKSTLLHLLAGLDTPDAGTVRIAGEDITRMSDRELTRLRREHIGFVFQSVNLLPTLSVAENIMLPLSIAGRTPEPHVVDRALERIGLTERRDDTPAQLTTGEQQLVAVARALICEPTVLLADEPTGDLDEQTADSLHGLLREMHAAYGLTSVIATHNPKLAAACDRVLRLEGGQLRPES
jgi:putative ABC transport system ATP-binding protein